MEFRRRYGQLSATEGDQVVEAVVELLIGFLALVSRADAVTDGGMGASTQAKQCRERVIE